MLSCTEPLPVLCAAEIFDHPPPRTGSSIKSKRYSVFHLCIVQIKSASLECVFSSISLIFLSFLIFSSISIRLNYLAFPHPPPPSSSAAAPAGANSGTPSGFKSISPFALQEAGNMTVCRSGAWGAKIITSAWWVFGTQVRRITQSCFMT